RLSKEDAATRRRTYRRRSVAPRKAHPACGQPREVGCLMIVTDRPRIIRIHPLRQTAPTEIIGKNEYDVGARRLRSTVVNAHDDACYAENYHNKSLENLHCITG